jgi:hypothetical protein
LFGATWFKCANTVSFAAIKTADQILKKNQGHGETEAMKALTLNSQGKHADEGGIDTFHTWLYSKHSLTG